LKYVIAVIYFQKHLRIPWLRGSPIGNHWLRGPEISWCRVHLSFVHHSPPTLVARRKTTQSKFNTYRNIVPSFLTQFQLYKRM